MPEGKLKVRVQHGLEFISAIVMVTTACQQPCVALRGWLGQVQLMTKGMLKHKCKASRASIRMTRCMDAGRRASCKALRGTGVSNMLVGVVVQRQYLGLF